MSAPKLTEAQLAYLQSIAADMPHGPLGWNNNLISRISRQTRRAGLWVFVDCRRTLTDAGRAALKEKS